MKYLALVAALSAALAGSVWWGIGQRAAAVEARGERDALARQAVQSRIAEAIARDLLDQEQDRTAALAAVIEQINGGPDVPLPDHLRELLRPDGL